MTEAQCPVHDVRSHLEVIGKESTLDKRTLSLIGSITRACKSDEPVSRALVHLLSSEQFLALEPKQRAYACLFAFYSVVYKERGTMALAYVRSHGIPHGSEALSVIFGKPYTGKGLAVDAFEQEIATLSTDSQHAIRASMIGLNAAVREGQALNSHDTSALLTAILHFSPASTTPLTSLPMLMVTKGALSAFADHVDAFTEAAVSAANQSPELYARKKEIIEYTLLNNLLPLASHAQAVEALYQRATHEVLSEPSPLALCRDAEGHLFVTRRITATQKHLEIVQAIGHNTTLGLRVGCPMFYHPLLKDMIKACAAHAAQTHA